MSQLSRVIFPHLEVLARRRVANCCGHGDGDGCEAAASASVDAASIAGARPAALVVYYRILWWVLFF